MIWFMLHFHDLEKQNNPSSLINRYTTYTTQPNPTLIQHSRTTCLRPRFPRRSRRCTRGVGSSRSNKSLPTTCHLAIVCRRRTCNAPWPKTGIADSGTTSLTLTSTSNRKSSRTSTRRGTNRWTSSPTEHAIRLFNEGLSNHDTVILILVLYCLNKCSS